MTEKPKVAIVAPCHIPPSEAWIAALKAEAIAGDATVIIVDDSNGHLGELPEEWMILDYGAQMRFLEELYEDFAKLFHKSSACRIVGHLWAYHFGYDIVIGLDSDCIVKRHFVEDHTQFLNKDYGAGWWNPIGYPNYSRGYPYSQRNWLIKANMGLWENVLDINGKDRLPNEPKEIKTPGNTVPAGFFPYSGMNFALTRDVMFGFLFLPNFNHENEDQTVEQFRRIDDVWGGYIFQKLLQKMHFSPMVGYPFVFHDTVVIAEEDAAEEAAMYKYEDAFIRAVDEVMNIATAGSFATNDMADAMTHFIKCWPEGYRAQQAPFNPLRQAFDFWEAAIKKYA